MKYQKTPLLTKSLILDSLKRSLKMLAPNVQLRNPPMFIVYLGAIFTSVYAIFHYSAGEHYTFNMQIAFWLWFTVLVANFGQSIAESRGQAQASYLRQKQVTTYAKKLQNGREIIVPSIDLKSGDIVLCASGDLIPADGDVIEGVATVDESAITGESAPVIREPGGDRNAVSAGTKVISDYLKIIVTRDAGSGFIEHVIRLIEGAKRQKSPNEMSLHIGICIFTFLFTLTIASLKLFADYSAAVAKQDISYIITIPTLIGLLVCLLPTTISALSNAVGIAGMDRLIRNNIIAKSGRSVETAGDIDLLILDKTGTITLGNRMATAFIPQQGVEEKKLARIAQLASLSDETPEGRSIMILAKDGYRLTTEEHDLSNTTVIPFSAMTRMSGIDFYDNDGKLVRQIRKGAPDAIKAHIETLGGIYSSKVDSIIQSIAKQGSTPLLVSDNQKIIGVIQLRDIVKGGLKEKFAEMRTMGIKTVLITGDNPLTAAAIAAEAGVDDFVAEATPEMKLNLIKQEQQKGRYVAMAGDGTNDAPALAQADVGVAMNTGTQASREAGNMIDLDSNPTKLIDIVETGKQMLMTRGALTTLSIANDVAKYFAIIPAIFGSLYAAHDSVHGPLSTLNIMYLKSPHSAILSAVIFNALTILSLIPIALNGITYRPQPANTLLLKNALIYGLGGMIAPFIGIKIIDLFLNLLGMV